MSAQKSLSRVQHHDKLSLLQGMEENSVGVLDLPNRTNLLSSFTILVLKFASSLSHPEVTCKAMSRSVMDTLSSIMKFPLDEPQAINRFS